MPKEALEWPHETAKKYKKDTPGQQEALDKKDEPKVKKIIKKLKKASKAHAGQAKDLDKAIKNEEKNCGCGQDPCITYGKKDVNEMFEDLLSDKQVKKAQDRAVNKAVSYVRKRDAEQKKRIAKVTKKILAPTQKTKVGGVQNDCLLYTSDAADE